jgi:hypothetical protein
MFRLVWLQAALAELAHGWAGADANFAGQLPQPRIERSSNFGSRRRPWENHGEMACEFTSSIPWR